MKRVVALILALVMALALCACGGSSTSEESAHVGQYTCTSIAMYDTVLEDAEGALDLKANGKGTLSITGETFDLTHTLEGDTLTLTIDGQDATGTYADGVITVDLFGATCTFEPSAE